MSDKCLGCQSRNLDIQFLEAENKKLQARIKELEEACEKVNQHNIDLKAQLRDTQGREAELARMLEDIQQSDLIPTHGACYDRIEQVLKEGEK